MAVTSERFLLENCYIDTSYYYLSSGQMKMFVQTIYNHEEYSNEQELNFIEIVASDGYSVENLTFEMIDNDGNVFNNDSITNATDKWIMTVRDYLDNEYRYDFMNMLESDNQEIEIYHLSGEKYMGVHRTNSGVMYFLPFIVPMWGNFSAIKESDGSELLLNKGTFIDRIDTSGLGSYKRIDNYHTLMFSIEGGGSDDPLETFYNTYQLSYGDLESAKRNGILTNDVVINTYSYPYVLMDNISDSTIKIGDLDTAIIADVLLGNSQLEIFSHELNYTYSGVDELILSIPFMSSDIYLDYEQVNNTVLKMVINYDNLTGQTTLFLYSDDTLLTTDSYDIESSIPINYVGVMSGYGSSEKRLSYSDVTLRFRFRDSVPLVDKTGYIEGRFDKVEGLNVSELDELNKQITYGLIL